MIDDTRAPQWRISNLRVAANPLRNSDGAGLIACTVKGVATNKGESLLLATLRNGVRFTIQHHRAVFRQIVPCHGVPVATLRFEEGFAGAFKVRVPAATVNGLVASSILLSDDEYAWATETGGSVTPVMVVSGLMAPGLADWGTRLYAQFHNIPQGIRLFVSCADVMSLGGLRAIHTVSDCAPFTPVPPGELFGNVPVAELPIIKGCARAVWEVTSRAAPVPGLIDFSVFASYDGQPGANSPAPGTAQINGGLAPTSSVFMASTEGIPRFADVSITKDLFTVVA